VFLTAVGEVGSAGVAALACVPPLAALAFRCRRAEIARCVSAADSAAMLVVMNSALARGWSSPQKLHGGAGGGHMNGVRGLVRLHSLPAAVRIELEKRLRGVETPDGQAQPDDLALMAQVLKQHEVSTLCTTLMSSMDPGAESIGTNST
jgi:hypothetical protein